MNKDDCYIGRLVRQSIFTKESISEPIIEKVIYGRIVEIKETYFIMKPNDETLENISIPFLK